MLTLIVADPFEPNDTIGTATYIGRGSQLDSAYVAQADQAYAARNGESDYYRWVAADSGHVTIDLLFSHSNDGNLDLYLYGSRGQLLDSSTSWSDNERVGVSVIANESYYIRVRADDVPPFGGTTCSGDICRYIPTAPRTGDYHLRVSASGDNDNNDQISEASRRTIGSPVTWSISPTAGDVDMHSFTVSAGQRLGFDVDRTSDSQLDSYLRLFDSSGRQLASNDDAAASGETRGLDSYLEYTFASSGTYYIGVSSYGNSGYNPITGANDRGSSTGSYTLALVNLGQVDNDNNDQISEASRRTIGSPVTWSISPTAGDVDMHSFTVSAGQRLGFDVDRTSDSQLDSYLRLFDASGRELARNDDAAAPGESPGLDSYLEYTFASSGTYYVAISSYGNSNYDPVTGNGDGLGRSTGGYSIQFAELRVSPVDGPGTPDPLLPDLLISQVFSDTGVTYDPVEGRYIVPSGRENVFQVEVRNVGQEAIGGNIMVRLRPGGVSGVVQGPLAPGESRLSAPIVFRQVLGNRVQFQLAFTVDPDNIVQESDEGNNTLVRRAFMP